MLTDAIDWSGLRAASVALRNVQAAARQAAANLPPAERQTFIERVNKRALREKWMDQANAVQAVQRAENPLSNRVQFGHQVLANTDADLSKRSKTAALKCAAKALEHAADKDPDELLAASQHVHGHAKTAALAGGWAEPTPAGVMVNLNLLGVHIEQEQGRVIDQENANLS